MVLREAATLIYIVQSSKFTDTTKDPRGGIQAGFRRTEASIQFVVLGFRMLNGAPF